MVCIGSSPASFCATGATQSGYHCSLIQLKTHRQYGPQYHTETDALYSSRDDRKEKGNEDGSASAGHWQGAQGGTPTRPSVLRVLVRAMHQTEVHVAPPH
jgi:hypothetical protein